jgi:hypothetical protein
MHAVVVNLNGSDLLIAVAAGVLLPALFTRPSILDPSMWPWPANERRRRQAEAMMTLFASLAANIVYLALRQITHRRLGVDVGRLLGLVALLLLCVALAVHLTPLFRPPAPAAWKIWILAIGLVVAGSLLASILLVNALEPRHGLWDLRLPDAVAIPVILLTWLAIYLYGRAFPEPSNETLARAPSDASRANHADSATPTVRGPGDRLASMASTLVVTLTVWQTARSIFDRRGKGPS